MVARPEYADKMVDVLHKYSKARDSNTLLTLPFLVSKPARRFSSSQSAEMLTMYVLCHAAPCRPSQTICVSRPRTPPSPAWSGPCLFLKPSNLADELRAVAQLMRPLGPNGLLYLAAAVSDFFV